MHSATEALRPNALLRLCTDREPVGGTEDHGSPTEREVGASLRDSGRSGLIHACYNILVLKTLASQFKQYP